MKKNDLRETEIKHKVHKSRKTVNGCPIYLWRDKHTSNQDKILGNKIMLISVLCCHSEVWTLDADFKEGC